MPEIPFERAAAANEPMPEGLNGAEQILYQALALLYQRYRSGYIDAGYAKREKKELLMAYEAAKFDLSMWEQGRRKLESIVGPVADYWREPTLTKANRIIDLIYGCEHKWKKGEQTRTLDRSICSMKS